MSSGNVYEKLFKQWTTVSKLVLDGKRDPEEISFVLQAVIDNKKPVENPMILLDWANFYQEVFGLDVDLSEVKIPERKEGFDRLIVVVQGMTPQRLFDKCAELFPSWKYSNENLDEIVISDRTAKNGHYAIWVRDRVEADEENKNLSANQLEQRGNSEITLEERMLDELKFFKETGKHLDVKKRTLCAGSRDADGSVPSAYWLVSRFRVYWSYAGDRNDGLRSRSVVS